MPSRATPGAAPDLQAIADRLHSAAIHLLRRLRKQDVAMALSPARSSALSVLVFGGRVTIGQLAAAEQVSTPTITRLVVGMERDGLLKRTGDEHDGRVVWLEATAKGARILKEGRHRRVAALAAELKALPPEEVELLSRATDLLQRLTRPGGP